MERRIFWLENLGGDEIGFEEHRIDIGGGGTPVVVTGFNLDFVDFSGDGQLDIVLRDSRAGVVWLEQPVDPSSPWRRHAIGDIQPDDLVGFVVADINDDGNPDVMAGAYSRGRRDQDGDVTAESAVGRLAWFEHPADPNGGWERHECLATRPRDVRQVYRPGHGRRWRRRLHRHAREQRAV